MSYERGNSCCCTVLCDDLNGQGDPVPFFFCLEEVCAPGQPVEHVPAYYELDKTTPYTLVGEAIICTVTPLNQFEGLNLIPLCDIDTGVIVGYFAVTRTEEDPAVFETLYFDPSGNSIPMAPANSETCTPPLDCSKTLGVLCYNPIVTDEPANDWIPTGTGQDPYTSTQVLASTGETLTFTVSNGIDASVSANLPNLSLNAGGAGLGDFDIDWDVPLVGPLALRFGDGIPLNVLDTFTFVPAPDSIVPNFGASGGPIIVTWDDVTGFQHIDMTFDKTANPAPGAQAQFRIDEATFIQSAAAITDQLNVAVLADTCQTPPVFTYWDLEAETEVTDPLVLQNLENCEVAYDCNNPLRVEDCVMKWDRDLCDRQDTVIALDIYSFDSDTEEVTRINGLTGAVLDSHTPAGVDWTNGTIYDPSGGFYYLYDNIAGEWHRYDSTNLAAGNTNLGVFGGDPIINGFTFGAFDPTTGFGYVGSGGTTRYRIDFDALTVLDLPAFNGELGVPFNQISSLSITEAGLHYVTNYQGPSAQNAFYIANPLTGALTHLGTEPGIQLNGSDYDQDTLSGWYGTDANLGILYRWTLPSGSDIAEIGTLANPGGTLGVGRATITSIRTPFQRVYHKDLATNQITHQDHDYDGTPYEILGTPEPCPVSVESANVPIISCYVDQNGDHFSAITLIDSDGQIVSTLVDGTVTDTSAGTLRLEPCSSCVQESHIVDLGTGETWTPASLPAGGVVTGITANIVIQAADNSITDSDGTILTNAPTGLSMSWNSNDNCGFVIPPQSIFAGTGGRIIINMTLRDDS